MTANDIYAVFVDLFPFISVEKFKLYRDDPKHSIEFESGNYGCKFIFTYLNANKYSLRTVSYEEIGGKK